MTTTSQPDRVVRSSEGAVSAPFIYLLFFLSMMEYSKSIHYLSAQDPEIYDGMAETWDYLDETQVPFLTDYLAVMEIMYHQTAYLEGSSAWMDRSTVEPIKQHYRSLRAGGYRSGYPEHFLGAPLVQELMK